MRSSELVVKELVPLQLMPRPARHVVLTRQLIDRPCKLQLNWAGKARREVAHGISVRQIGCFDWDPLAGGFKPDV